MSFSHLGDDIQWQILYNNFNFLYQHFGSYIWGHPVQYVKNRVISLMTLMNELLLVDIQGKDVMFNLNISKVKKI